MTGEDLVRRKDDNEETLRSRMESYNQKTAPLIEYYKQLNLLTTADASQPMGAVTKFIRSTFKLGLLSRGTRQGELRLDAN